MLRSLYEAKKGLGKKAGEKCGDAKALKRNGKKLGGDRRRELTSSPGYRLQLKEKETLSSLGTDIPRKYNKLRRVGTS